MGIAERRERERTRRRNDIVDAAEKVFFSKGLDAATMDDVASAAELSKGTLYLYFKSKDDLYLAIAVRASAILFNLFVEANASCALGIDKVEAIGRAYMTFYHQEPDYFEAVISTTGRDFAACSEGTIAHACHMQGERLIGLLVEAVETGKNDGTMRSDLDPFMTAVMLWAQTNGILQMLALKGIHLMQEHDMDMDKFVRTFFENTRRMFAA